MKSLVVFLFTGLFMYPFYVKGQISPQQRRKILYQVITVLDNYEKLMYIDGYSAEEDFKNLFISDKVMLYNDLLGFSSAEEMPIEDYIFTMKNKVKNPTFFIKDIQLENIIDKEDKYQAFVTFNKDLSYSDVKGILFSNKEYYGKDYNIEMCIEVDRECTLGKISSIKGSINSQKERLVDGKYVVLNFTNPLDKEVLCNGKKIIFNSFEQAFLPIDFELSFLDPDMKVSINHKSSNNRVISLSYNLKSWNMQPFYEMSLMDAYHEKEVIDGLQSSSSIMEMGIKMKYLFPRKSKTKFGVGLGLGYSKSNIDLSLNDLSYHYSAEGAVSDIDGEDYERHYQVHEAKQSFEMTGIVIPLSFECETKFGKVFSTNLEAGVKGYLNLDSKTTNFSVDQNVYGVYHGYGDPIIIDDPSWGYNGFGHSILNKANMISDDFNVQTFTADVFVGVGFSVNMWKSLSFKAGIKYQYGIMNVLESESNFIDNSVGHKIEKENALISYTLPEGEVSRSLISIAKNINRNSLLLNLGINYKF